MKKGTFIPLEVGAWMDTRHSSSAFGSGVTWRPPISRRGRDGVGSFPERTAEVLPMDRGGVDPRSHRSVSGSFPFGRPIPPERFPFCSPIERGEALGFFSFGIQAQDQNPAVRQAHLRARARHGDERCASRVPRVEEGKETNRKSTFGRGDGANGRGGRRRVGSAEGDGTRSDP